MKKQIITLSFVLVAALAFGEKVATQKWVKKENIKNIQTNGLDEASIKAIVEAKANNGKMFCDEDGPCYIYKLKKTADGKYVNERVEMKVSNTKMEYGTYQGAIVLSNSIPTLKERDLLALKRNKEGFPILMNASNVFEYREEVKWRDEYVWTKATVTNDVAWGWSSCRAGHYDMTLNATNGTSAYLYAFLMNEENWLKTTGETNTAAYADINEYCHWTTNAILKDTSFSYTMQQKQ